MTSLVEAELEVCWSRIRSFVKYVKSIIDAFADTKSHIPVANASARIEIPQEREKAGDTRDSQTRLKRSRPIGSKDNK